MNRRLLRPRLKSPSSVTLRRSNREYRRSTVPAQRRRHGQAVRDARCGQGAARGGPVPVQRGQPLDLGHAQPQPDQHVLRRGRRAAAREHVHHRGGPPRGAGRRGCRADAGRAVARGAGVVPDLGPREHRRRAQDQPGVGRVPGGGRHRPARDPRPVRRGPQRLLPDPGQLPGARRRVARGAAPARGAGRGPVRRVRRADPRRADQRRRRGRLTRETGEGGKTMHGVETLVVGAGQAGLAASRCLTEFGADHVVTERGRVAERWRTARWDSLRLLSPNWMSRLPFWAYTGTDPDGYMPAPELVRYLEGYAGSFTAPVHEYTTVDLIEAAGSGLRVVTDQGTWLARNVVVATGTENRAYVPPVASGIDPGTRQLTAHQYRGPHQIPDGGVLVVGASASGVQIADELRRAGRPVTLSAGRHARLPRRYRGRDIFWWMDRAGVLGQTIDQAHDARSARRAPSLQLSGRGRPVGLDALAAGGVRLAGRLVAAEGRRLSFADDLPATIGGARARMERLLRTIDGYITHSGEDAGPADPPAPFTAPIAPAALDLRRAGISA